MATGVASWSTTASSNATADSAVNWAEGQAPSTVNDSGRGMMSSVAKFRDDISGALTTGGSNTAYTVTTNQSFASLAALGNRILTIIPHATSGAAPTLAVDGLTAKNINIATTVNIPTGMLVAGTPYIVYYGASVGEFLLLGTPAAFNAVVATTGTFSSTLAVTGISTFSAALRAANGTVGAPSYSWTNDTDCGWYRIGASNIGFAIDGSNILNINADGVTLTGDLQVTDAFQVLGAVSLPAGSVANAALAVPPAMVKIATGSIAGGIITFSSGIDSTYRAYKLIIEQLVPANDASTIFVEISQSASFKTSGYIATVNAASGSTTAQSATTSNVPLSAASNVDAGATTVGLSGEVTLYSPASTTMKKHIIANTAYLNFDATSLIVVNSSGYYNTDTAAIDGIRIKSSGAGGLSTGQATLYGLT